MLLALAIFCALLEGVFTALEVALGAVSRTRLRSLLDEAQKEESGSEHDSSNAGAISRIENLLALLDDTPRSTLLFITVTSLSLWTATCLLTWQALQEDWPDWTVPLALTGILFLAEVLPVLIAAPRAEALALRGTPLIRGAMRLLSPLLLLVGGAGRGLARLFGAREQASSQVTEDELRTALAAAEEEGTIESGERALLEGAMDFRSRLVREVMTSRREIVAVSAETPLHEILRTAIQEGHSRLPIYEGTLDKIIGIASTKDLIPFLRATQVNPLENPDGWSDRTAREVARVPFFVPETKRIAPTLEELRGQRSLLAIVVDDEGSTVGLVTLEDLLEEIVGDIQDEYDEEEPTMKVDGDNIILCDGRETVRDAGRFWEKHFEGQLVLQDHEDEEAEETMTLAALALHLFDGVPEAGDRIAAGALKVEDEVTGAINLEIARMDGPRIAEVRLTRIPSKEAAPS